MPMCCGSLLSSPLNKYHLTKVQLGKTSFGEIIQATDKKTGKTWAIKKLVKSLQNYHQDNVKLEIETMRRCEHDNILKLREYFETKSEMYIVLDYGTITIDLPDRIKQKQDSLTEVEAATWVSQILRALCYLFERKICHRDAKPDNWLFYDKQILKLSGFHCACFVEEGKLLRDSVGTDAFKAPEMYFDPKAYSFPVDMWAAGLTFHAIMTGGVNGPFFDEKSCSIREDLLRDGTINFLRKDGGLFQTITDQMDTKVQELMDKAINIASIFRESARELCQEMVDPNAGTRIVPANALQHKWFKEVGPLTSVAPPAGQTLEAAEAGVVTGQADASSSKSTRCCVIS